LREPTPPPQVHWDQTDEGQPMCATECMHVDGIRFGTRCFPSRRPDAIVALQTKIPTVALREEILVYPIFVDTTNASYNATFNRGYAVHDCPAEACYNVETGIRFWGMVELSVPAALRR
jgi:hypothetical protein